MYAGDIRTFSRNPACTGLFKSRELADSSSFNCRLYSEIEEVGWEHLVHLNEDLKFLSFRIQDARGRVHIMEIHLGKTYPESPPSVSGDIPCLPKLEWSGSKRLKDAVIQFKKHVDELDDFWSTLDNIDKSLSVVSSKLPCRAICNRLVDIGNDCTIMLSINAKEPRSLPECRFLGPDSSTSSLMKAWSRNCKRWTKEKCFTDNLESVFGFQLPKPPDKENNDQQPECGICYAQHLPVEDERGAKTGFQPDYQCDNANCCRAFHSLCLRDWLRSITTTRQSFDVLFGSCPYCSEPIAVKLRDTLK